MAESTTAVLPHQTKAIVAWRGTEVIVTFQHVKQNICPTATDQEVVMFLKLCENLQLNPLVNEVYLVKYSERDKAAMVVAIGSYLKAAETNDNYDGHEAGIILKGPSGAPELREGAFLLEEERQLLVGGWARVWRKDRSRPTYVAVNKMECIKLTREGKPTQHWAPEKQPWMLRKVALKRALVESFPSLFAGTISSAEVSGDFEVGPEVEEGTLPPALEKGGKPDWKKFWSKVKSELDLTQEQARELLKVSSIKKDLIDQDVTMEQMWEGLISAVQRQSDPPGADVETGEIIEGEASEVPGTKSRVDMDQLRKDLQEMNWADAGKWIRNRYKNAAGSTIKELVESLTPEQQDEFVYQVQERLDIHRAQKAR